MTIATIKNKVYSVLNKTTKKQTETQPNDPDRKIINCDLLPCPCCGGEVKLHRVNTGQVRDPHAKHGVATVPICFIRCHSCGISTQQIVVEHRLNGTYTTEKAAVKRLEKYWNRTVLRNDGRIVHNDE